MPTFAIPNEKRGTTDLKFGKISSLKRLKESTRSKYREKYNLSRSVNFFYEIISVRDKLRII